MSDQAVTYPSDASATTFLLTVRGTIAAPSLPEAREIHNATAGAAEGVAAARSLGDLSHNVYVGHGAAQPGELLFIDYWNSLSGLGQFFSNPQVQAGAGMLFRSRENPVWEQTEDFGNYHLATPSGRGPAGVGIITVEVTSLDKAASAFRTYADATINQARMHGMVSHSLWTRVAGPGAESAPEIIGVDMWLDADEMARYYDMSLGFEHLGPIFAGTPDTSVWQSAPDSWVEW